MISSGRIRLRERWEIMENRKRNAPPCPLTAEKSAELCKEQRGVPYLSAAFAGDDRNRAPLWRTDRTHLEGRRSEDQDRIRESSADL